MKNTDQLLSKVENKNLYKKYDYILYKNDYISSLKIDHIKKYDYKSCFGDVTHSDSLDAVRSMIESFAILDEKRQLASVMPITMPRNLVSPDPGVDSSAILAGAIFRFNKMIPREGVRVNWKTNTSEGPGTMWGILSDSNGIAVQLTMDFLPCGSCFPEIKMNGNMKIKKSSGVLLSLDIERLYVMDDKGMETTLYSTI